MNQFKSSFSWLIHTLGIPNWYPTVIFYPISNFMQLERTMRHRFDLHFGGHNSKYHKKEGLNVKFWTPNFLYRILMVVDCNDQNMDSHQLFVLSKTLKKATYNLGATWNFDANFEGTEIYLNEVKKEKWEKYMKFVTQISYLIGHYKIYWLWVGSRLNGNLTYILGADTCIKNIAFFV